MIVEDNSETVLHDDHGRKENGESFRDGICLDSGHECERCDRERFCRCKKEDEAKDAKNK